MSKQIIDWDSWDDEECKAAWQKLTGEYSIMQVMHALWGGLKSGDVELTGSICNRRGFYGEQHVFEVDFSDADGIEESWISHKVDVPISILKGMVVEHEKIMAEPETYSSIFTEADIENAAGDFHFSWKDD